MTEVRKVRGQDEGLKAYTKPTLIHYGRVEEITKGAAGSIDDFFSGFQAK